jgi:hypothetical protein
LATMRMHDVSITASVAERIIAIRRRIIDRD